MSATHEACVKALAAECEGRPHRDGPTPCLREVAQPGREGDRRAQGKRRSPVRGWRAIARRVRAERRQSAALASCPAPEPPPPALPAGPTPEAGAGSALGGGRTASARDTTGWAGRSGRRGRGGRGWARGLRGGSGHAQRRPGRSTSPPGVRMREACQAGRESLERHVEAQNGGVPRRCGSVWPLAVTAAWRGQARPGST
jgi:hypothetical protein